MTYQVALKEWNSHRKRIDPTHVWALPRKGTPEHTQVLEIQHGIFGEKVEAVSKARKAGKKMAEKKAAEAPAPVPAPAPAPAEPEKRGRGRPRGVKNKKYEDKPFVAEDLEKMKLTELHALMRAKKIKKTSKKTKAEIIEMIRSHKPERSRSRSRSSVRVAEVADGASGAAIADVFPGSDGASNDIHMAGPMFPQLHDRSSKHRSESEVPMIEKQGRDYVGSLAHPEFRKNAPSLIERQ